MSGELSPPRSPFKGLSAFDDSELDALFFFGRELERDLVAANVVAKRMTVLYGESGVGKSSLLRAAVVRRLRELEPDAVVTLFDTWSDDVSSMLDAVRDADSAYLILDQFEEYFVYRGEAEGERTILYELPELMHANPLVNVLISLREDSLARLDALKAGLPAVFANQLRLEHLDREAARAAIVGPVVRWNELTAETVEVEPELVDAVIAEVAGVGERSGRIEAPYLQLVLERLWDEERATRSNALRLSTLRSLGGAETIVREHLERALDVLDSEAKDVAANMFDHLVTPSGTKVAHRVGDLAEYASVPEKSLRPVLATLSRERILRTVDGAADGRERYEIFHDVLADPVRAWRQQRRLERERRLANRRQRRLLAFAVASAVALAVVAAVALFALVQRSHARSQARHAHARELAATSLADLTRDPVRSLQLALSAARLERSPRVADVLLSALVESHLRLVLPAGAAVTAAALSPDSRYVLVGASNGRAEVYELATSRRVATLRIGGKVRSGSFSRDGKKVLVAGGGRIVLRGLGGDHTRFVLKHPGVREAVFGPHDAEIVSGGSDRNVRLWRVGDGKPVQTIHLDGVVRAVALTSTRIAAAWVGGRNVAHVALLDAHGGQLVADLRGTMVEFSPDGSRLATGHPDSLARIYDATDGRLLWRLGHSGAVTSVDFNPDGTQLATASADGAARVWDVRTGERLLLMPIGTNTVESARYSHDGTFIATAEADGSAHIWSSLNGRELATLNGHRDAVTDASFSRDGLVVTASDDGTARVWDTGLENQLRVLGRAHGGFVRAGFAAGGTVAFGASIDGSAQVWSTRTRRLLFKTNPRLPLVDAAMSGSLLATVDQGGNAALWDVRTRMRLASIRVSRPGRRVAFSADGSTLIVAGGRVVKVVDVSTRRQIATRRLPGIVTDARFGVGTEFATAVNTGRVSVWTRSGALVRSFAGGPTPVVAVALSPDGALVAAGNRRGTARIWSITSGRLQHRLARARTPLTDVEFSHDGRLLATAAIGGDAHIFTVADGRSIHTLRAHRGRVARVVFSPDDRWLITAGGPTSGGLWQLSTGHLLFYLRGHTAQLEDAAFAPDGEHILTASDDRTVRTYTCDVCGSVYELAQLARTRLSRVSSLLTLRERRRYLGG